MLRVILVRNVTSYFAKLIETGWIQDRSWLEGYFKQGILHGFARVFDKKVNKYQGAKWRHKALTLPPEICPHHFFSNNGAELFVCIYLNWMILLSYLLAGLFALKTQYAVLFYSIHTSTTQYTASLAWFIQYLTRVLLYCTLQHSYMEEGRDIDRFDPLYS